MNASILPRSAIRLLPLLCAVLLIASCAHHGPNDSQNVTLSLSGTQEVPPNTSSAGGTGSITINHDRSLSGMISVSSMTPTAAHIHDGAPGENGAVVVGLSKTSDTTFSVPAGTTLTEAQYATLKRGNYYVNVHSAEFPNGEIRAQIKMRAHGY